MGSIATDLSIHVACAKFEGPFGPETYWMDLERVQNSSELLYRLRGYGVSR
jgi:hypothetical protein